MLLDMFLTNYRDPKSYIVTGTLNGNVRFIFDLRAWGQKFAFYYQRWENEHVNVLSQLYSGDIFLDVGSSLGLYVVCLGSVIRSLKGSIISVEPVPFNLRRQKEIAKLNNLEDIVTFVPCALGAKRTVVKIKTDPERADNNAIIAADGDLAVPVEELDSLTSEHEWQRIGMMKIDVEGYEPMVIAGARNTIKRDRPIIFAEFNRERMSINGFTMDDTWRFLITDLEYTCFSYKRTDRKLHILKTPGMNEELFFIPSEVAMPEGLCA